MQLFAFLVVLKQFLRSYDCICCLLTYVMPLQGQYDEMMRHYCELLTYMKVRIVVLSVAVLILLQSIIQEIKRRRE